MPDPTKPYSLNAAFHDACKEMVQGLGRNDDAGKPNEFSIANAVLQTEGKPSAIKRPLIASVSLQSRHDEAIVTVRRSGQFEGATEFVTQLLWAVAHLLDVDKDPQVQAAIRKVGQAIL
jgi:hypothetical protein